MFLKKLEISGFKSFAEGTVLDFDKKSGSITAIVGPNGSGKSNVVDAIRWVLGEQSYKLLRSKKSEDVVFSGSTGKSKGSLAQVSMTLDNTGKDIPIDFTEVNITRKVFRSGESEYLINKSKVRLIDIHELLSKCGFGQTTYTVLGQGMVDQLLFYGPQERKVLFDEAAGVKKYQIKREQAIKKLEATDKNLIRLKDILSELAPRVENLRRLVKRAEGRKELLEELTNLQNNFYSSLYLELDQKLTEHGKNKAELNHKIQSIDKEIKELRAEIDSRSKENSFDKEKDELEDSLRKTGVKRDELLKKVAFLEGQIDQEKIFGKGKDFTRAKEDERQLKEKITFLKKKLAESSEEISAHESDVAKIKTEAEALEIKIKEIDTALSDSEALESAKKFVQVKEVIEGAKGLRAELRKELKELEALKNEIVTALKNNSFDAIAEKFQEFNKYFNEFSSKAGGYFETEDTDERASLEATFQELRKRQEEISELFKRKNELQEKLNILSGEVNKKEAAVFGRKHIVENQTKELEFSEKQLESIQKQIEGKEDVETDKLKDLKIQLEEKNTELKEIETEISTKREKLYSLNEEERNAGRENFEKERLVREKDFELSRIRQEISLIDIEEAKLTVRKEDLDEEVSRLTVPFKTVDPDALDVSASDRSALRNKIENVRRRLESIGDVDEETKEEFEELSARHEESNKQTEDLISAKTDLEKVIKELDARIKDQFSGSFSTISKEFNRYFKILFEGGDASLSLERTDDEDGSDFGIEITACPPGKRVKNLNSLSGGERTLTSLALLFAILSHNPSPFVVLDEVDAALDETNTLRFLKIIEDLSKKTQFIVITHNRETMKIANTLYGVTMNENHISKLLSLKLNEIPASGK